MKRPLMLILAEPGYSFLPICEQTGWIFRFVDADVEVGSHFQHGRADQHAAGVYSNIPFIGHIIACFLSRMFNFCDIKQAWKRLIPNIFQPILHTGTGNIDIQHLQFIINTVQNPIFQRQLDILCFICTHFIFFFEICHQNPT